MVPLATAFVVAISAAGMASSDRSRAAEVIIGAGANRQRTGTGVIASFNLTAISPIVQGLIAIDHSPVRETKLFLADGTTKLPVQECKRLRTELLAANPKCFTSTLSKLIRPACSSALLAASISERKYGWQRTTPCPKVIMLRVKMLCPSTVIPSDGNLAYSPIILRGPRQTPAPPCTSIASFMTWRLRSVRLYLTMAAMTAGSWPSSSAPRFNGRAEFMSLVFPAIRASAACTPSTVPL